ncbi:MAG: alpha/beta hydrolase [Pseudomonadota bacterium]
MTATTHHYASHDGLQLFYRDFAGEGGRCPVVCLPGLTRNSRDFEDLAPHIAPARRVITPDLRGRGLSDRDPEWRNYHPGTYVQDTWGLLDTLDIDRVVLIGTSLGGLMSMTMGAQRADRVAGIVLNDVGCEIAPEGLARIMGYTGKLQPVTDWHSAADQARSVYGDSMQDLDDAMWLRLAKRGFRESDDGVPVLDADPNIGVALREVGATESDPWASFAALSDIPVLLLRGEHSDILSRDTIARMRDMKPDLETLEIANRGHVPLLDEAESLTAIDHFLERVP